MVRGLEKLVHIAAIFPEQFREKHESKDLFARRAAQRA